MYGKTAVVPLRKASKYKCVAEGKLDKEGRKEGRNIERREKKKLRRQMDRNKGKRMKERDK